MKLVFPLDSVILYIREFIKLFEAGLMFRLRTWFVNEPLNAYNQSSGSVIQVK